MKLAFLLLVLGLPITSMSAEPIFQKNNECCACHHQVKDELPTNGLNEVVVGTSIGLITGIVTAEIDKKNPTLLPLTWLFSYYIRTALVKDISAVMHTKGDLMSMCSCAVSWISYFSYPTSHRYY